MITQEEILAQLKLERDKISPLKQVTDRYLEEKAKRLVSKVTEETVLTELVADTIEDIRDTQLTINSVLAEEAKKQPKTPLRTSTEVGVTIDNPFISTREQLYRAGTRAAKSFSGFYPSATVGSVSPIDPLQDYTFGNLAGSRVVVRDRPFRVRDATVTPENVSVTGDDDLTNGDVQAVLSGRTYGWVQTANAGLTYRDVQLKGRRY